MRSALLAIPLLVALAGCVTSFADRFAAGSARMNTPQGAGYLVIVGPRLQRVLNDCIPAGTPGASPTIVLVAEVQPDGRALDVDVEPDGPGTDCVVDALTSEPLPRPPLAPGAAAFPVGLKIETR